MRKITFTFPDYKSLWDFKDQTQAINVAITPKMNRIAGLFSSQEVDVALSKFNAVVLDNTVSCSAAVKTDPYKTKTSWLDNYYVNYSAGIKRMRQVSYHINKFAETFLNSL